MPPFFPFLLVDVKYGAEWALEMISNFARWVIFFSPNLRPEPQQTLNTPKC
jgi:hypothetical protein